MVRIVEVGPRDGLQNVATIIPTEVKVGFVNLLSRSGLTDIEVSSFVAPRRVPQLADAEEVFARVKRRNDVLFSALVPNMQGLLRAITAGVSKIAVLTAASERFSTENTGMNIAQSLAACEEVVALAVKRGLSARGYISTAFHCPFAGRIVPDEAVVLAEELLLFGVSEVAFGDTTGQAKPDDVRALLNEAQKRGVPIEKIAMHFHDTYGNAAGNVRAAYEEGVRVFDGSVGGLGGCPYAPGAKGNIATETLVAVLAELGEETRVKPAILKRAHELVAPYL